MSSKADRFISVGKVGAPFGVDGAFKIVSFTEHPEDILDFSPWFIRKKDQWFEVELEGEAVHGKYLVAKLPNCDAREEAQQWTNCEIAVKRAQLPELPAGKYYWTDLEGLTVKNITGETLGVLDEVKDTGGTPVMIIQGEQRHLIPYVFEKFVKEVDLASNIMTVDWDSDF